MKLNIQTWNDNHTFAVSDYVDPFQIKFGLFGGDGGGGGGGGGGGSSNPSPNPGNPYAGGGGMDIGGTAGDPTGGGGGSDIGGGDGGGDSGGGDSGGGDSGGGGSGGSSGTTFGINGVSKTGSTAQDAAIGYTSSEGSGTAGSNYDALASAPTSVVDNAVEMASQGASVSQIGDMIVSSQGTNSIAGSASTGSTASLFSGGKVISGYDVEGNPTYSSARTTSAPTSVTDTVADATGNTIGAGFSTVTDSLRDDDFSGMMSTRGDVTGVSGYDNASKIQDAGMTFGPSGFGPEALDPFGGRGASIQSLTDLEGTGFSSEAQSAGIGRSLFGGGEVETDKKGLQVAEIAKGYGRDFGMNLGQFMNTPNMAGVTPTMAMSKGKGFSFSNYAPYSDISSKLGGQSPTYGVTLADYNFASDGTVTGRFSGQNEGFLSSPIGGVFSFLAPAPIGNLMSVGGKVSSLMNASKKGAFSTISNMLGLVSPQAAAILSPISAYANFQGVDVDSMLGLGANQGYMSQTRPTDLGGGDNDNVSEKPVVAPPSNEIKPIDKPDTAPTDLLRRRRRRAGEDVYGVSSSNPFLDYSDDINTSGMGSFTGSARSGQFKSAPTGR